MNRSLMDSLRNIPLQHRRGHSLNGVPNSKDSSPDDNLDLFSNSRRSLSLASSDEPYVPVKLGRHSIGSAKQGKNGLDDFLSSSEGGKHDYDWLLTPPGTPLVASSDGNESQQGLNIIAPRRSVSTTKASRLSVSQSESNNHVAARPTPRSKSMMRPSVSSLQYSSYSNNKSTNILNTSSASVSSYIRPSTPTRSSSITTTRPSTPSGRSTVSSRSTTPSRSRPASSSAVDKPRQSQTSRLFTPTSSRPQISSNVNSPANRVTTSSRPSTPTRRSTTPSLSPVSVPSTPGGGRSLPNGGRNSVSRPSSPSPRVRSTAQLTVLSHCPMDTPPNLRTTLPDRPISAGRSRPGVAALAAKGNVEPMMTTNNSNSYGSSVPTRGRQSSPVVSRGRLAAESTGRGHRALAPANENLGDAAMDSRRELLTTRKQPAKTTSTDSTGFGRTISKKSLDMALRHMDIRNGSNGSRPLTGSNLFPQSIRSSNQRSQPGAVSVNGNHLPMGTVAENGNHINARFYESGSEENRNQSSAKLSNIDIYESSRYDMILLKEDLTNTNWLHSLDDKTDQGPIFDKGFELLPELFDPL